MLSINRDEGAQLFRHYRKNRDGIRQSPEMTSVCLICGSIHIEPKQGTDNMLVCSNCGFAFYRYACPACGQVIDGRDPQNRGCAECGQRICTCGSCGCASSV